MPSWAESAGAAGVDAVGAGLVAQALDDAMIERIAGRLVRPDGGQHFVRKLRYRIQGNRGRREGLAGVVLRLVHQMSASILIEFVIVPGVDAVSGPVVCAACRAARPPVAGYVQPGSLLFGGGAVNADRAAVADVEIGVSAFRAGQPEVIDYVAESRAVEREL